MSGQGQMTMLRQARRVGKPGHMLVLLDMAEVLLDAGYPLHEVAEALRFPTQGNVTRTDRLKEALDISRAWPSEWLLVARQRGADWHALREPARWWRNGDVEREAVISFTQEVVGRLRRWPTVDEYRRAFGFAPGHKGPGDQTGQGALL